MHYELHVYVSVCLQWLFSHSVCCMTMHSISSIVYPVHVYNQRLLQDLQVKLMPPFEVLPGQSLRQGWQHEWETQIGSLCRFPAQSGLMPFWCFQLDIIDITASYPTFGWHLLHPRNQCSQVMVPENTLPSLQHPHTTQKLIALLIHAWEPNIY